jgi:hypothetical protein
MIPDTLTKEQYGIIGHNKIMKFNHKTGFGYPTSRYNNNIVVDQDTEYVYNSFGYRSKEFIQNEDLLIAGCSHSFGLGIPENETWASIVAKQNNFSYSNLSIIAASITTVVQNIFAYIQQFGKPKTLMILFPEFNRLHLPNMQKILKDEMFFKNNYNYSIVKNNGLLSDRPIFSKLPHKIDDVLPNESIVFLNAQAILNLELFCNESGIKLLYSIWGDESIKLIKLFKSLDTSFYTGFIDNDLYLFPRYNHLSNSSITDPNCHKEIQEKNKKTFYFAGDSDKNYIGHFNSHIHYHISECFNKELVK